MTIPKAEVWLWGPLYPQHLEFALTQLNEPQHHVAVDGGAQIKAHLKASVVASWWAVGDGDSSKAGQLDETHPRDKDCSDLALALANDRAQAAKLRCFGFCGGRPDHHLLALGTFLHHLQQAPQGAQARLDQHWLLLSPGHWRGNLGPSTVSLMSLWPNHLTLEGDWRWPLSQRLVRPLDDLLLSNQTGPGAVTVTSEHALLIWSEQPINNWWEPV